MVDELAVRARLIADLLEAGINPDKYFRPQDPWLDALEQLDVALTYQQQWLSELRRASGNARRHLTTLL